MRQLLYKTLNPITKISNSLQTRRDRLLNLARPCKNQRKIYQLSQSIAKRPFLAKTLECRPYLMLLLRRSKPLVKVWQPLVTGATNLSNVSATTVMRLSGLKLQLKSTSISIRSCHGFSLSYSQSSFSYSFQQFCAYCTARPTLLTLINAPTARRSQVLLSLTTGTMVESLGIGIQSLVQSYMEITNSLQ